MVVRRMEGTAPQEVAGCPGVTKRVVLGRAEGSEEIALRYFALTPKAETPRHAHDFPHLVKVEVGRGVAVDEDGHEVLLSPGDYVYVASNELHNFKNTGDTPFEFICIVPARGEPPVA